MTRMVVPMIADVTPYRHFRGQAREALEFYRDVFGLDLKLMTYGESGFADQAGGNHWSNEWIMHGELYDAGRKVLFGADVPQNVSSPQATTLLSLLLGTLMLALRSRTSGKPSHRGQRFICL